MLYEECAIEIWYNNNNNNPERVNSETKLDQNTPDYVPLSVTMATELSKFLVKKDLLFSRLTQFSDEPERYVAWKAAFLPVGREMGVSDKEEMDPLVMWLGQESSQDTHIEWNIQSHIWSYFTVCYSVIVSFM